MHIKPVISAIFLLVFALAIPQDNLHAQQKRGYVIGYIIDNNGDTLYVDKIRAAYVYNRPESWKKSKSWRQYYRMVYNFKKTYPYALKAKVIIQDAEHTQILQL